MGKLVRLGKPDCGEKITLEKSREAQLAMLDKLAIFCDEHKLRYFLSGGTLLGAMRHQGFIPWDDDVDVNMPRPDCEKLMQLTKGKLGKYILTEPDTEYFSPECCIYRIYDFDIVIESFGGGATTKHPFYYPLYIDIFPIEGLPDGKWLTRLRYMEIVALRKMQRSAGLEHMMGGNIFAHIFHIISRLPAKWVGYKRWSQMIQKTATKYNYDTQKYVGVMTAPAHTIEEKVIKADYEKVKDVLFESKFYHAPGNYDTYLTQLYGDYMKMPPPEQQKSHHVFNIYQRKNLAAGSDNL